MNTLSPQQVSLIIEIITSNQEKLEGIGLLNFSLKMESLKLNLHIKDSNFELLLTALNRVSQENDLISKWVDSKIKEVI